MDQKLEIQRMNRRSDFKHLHISSKKYRPWQNFFANASGHQSTNESSQSLLQQESDLPPKEQIDSSKNKDSTTDFHNLEPAAEPRNSSFATEMDVEASGTPESTLNVNDFERKTSPRKLKLLETIKVEGKFDEGYDSDGEIGPFFNAAEVEGNQFFEEMPLGTSADLTTTAIHLSKQILVRNLPVELL